MYGIFIGIGVSQLPTSAVRVVVSVTTNVVDP